MSERLVEDIRTTAQSLGVSPSTVARMVKAGTLPSILVNGRRMIPTAAVSDFVTAGASHEFIPQHAGRARGNQ